MSFYIHRNILYQKSKRIWIHNSRINVQGWRDDSVVKRICCCCRGPKVPIQHRDGRSLWVIPVLESHLTSMSTRHASSTHIYLGPKYSYTYNSFLKKNKGCLWLARIFFFK